MKLAKVIIAAIAIFLSGVFTGGVIVSLRLDRQPGTAESERTPRRDWGGEKGEDRVPGRDRPPGRVDRRMSALLDRMDRDMGLTPEQRAAVEQELLDSQDRMRQIWKNMEPLAREEFLSVQRRIEAHLTPEQQEIYRKILEERKGPPRRPDDPHRGPGPPGPPHPREGAEEGTGAGEPDGPAAGGAERSRGSEC